MAIKHSFCFMCSYKKQFGNITQHEKPIHELKPRHTVCLEIACHHTSACLLLTNSYSTKCMLFIYKYDIMWLIMLSIWKTSGQLGFSVFTVIWLYVVIGPVGQGLGNAFFFLSVLRKEQHFFYWQILEILNFMI